MSAPVIAIDLGLKRIGLACSTDGTLVTPLPAVARKNRNQAAAAVREVLQIWEAKQVVIGIPLGGQSEGEMRRRTTHFMKLVNYEAPVAYEDESDSSLEAEALMKGEIRYVRDGRIDSLSAMIILQRWLVRSGG